MGLVWADLVVVLVIAASAAPGSIDIRGLDISNEFAVVVQSDQASRGSDA